MAIDMMDRHGIAAAMLSLSAPGVHFGDDRQAADLARSVNDELSEVAARHPRLGAFAVLPLPSVELACTEAVRALDLLGLDGVGLLTSYGGCYLGHPAYDRLFRALDDRKAVVLVHPAPNRPVAESPLGLPHHLIEYPFETTRAAVNLVFADVLDRFPGIRFVLSHGGGTLPYLSWRVAAVAEQQLSRMPPRAGRLSDRYPTALTERLDVVSGDHIMELLGRFYFDLALTGGPAGLGTLAGFADPRRLLFGSDWPYAGEAMVLDQMSSFDDDSVLPRGVREQVAHSNAETLFSRPLPPSRTVAAPGVV